MKINGEKVWVPSCRRDLIAGLKRMGINKVAGVSIWKLPKQELLKAYCRERARTVRRQQAEGHGRERSKEAIGIAQHADIQLKLF